MKKISISLIGLWVLMTSPVMASSYILSFSGQFVIDTATPGRLTSGNFDYSGSLTLDFSVADVQSDLAVGSYENIVTSALVTINGTTYTGPSGVINLGGVSNDLDGVGDFFGVGVHLTNGKDDLGFFAIQFQDSSGFAFASDALPTIADFSVFDAYDPENEFSTGVFLPMFDGPGGQSLFMSLDSAQFTQVPLPAGVWLMISALSTLLWRRKS